MSGVLPIEGESDLYAFRKCLVGYVGKVNPQSRVLCVHIMECFPVIAAPMNGYGSQCFDAQYFPTQDRANLMVEPSRQSRADMFLSEVALYGLR